MLLDLMPLTLLQMLCSWLPLSLGGATYYLSACPAMSYFLATGDTSVVWQQYRACHRISMSASACAMTIKKNFSRLWG